MTQQEWETMGNDVRNDGTTTRQMQRTSANGVYVWLNGVLDYPKALARHLGRADLKIVSADNLERLAGQWVTAITVDHAAKLTERQWDAYERIRVVEVTE